MLNLIDRLKSMIKHKNKYKRFRFKRQHEPDIIFDGVLVAKTCGMSLYKTKCGNYVCNGCSKVCGSDLVMTQRVIFTKGETEEAIQKAIFDCFGYCKTAKRLYKKAGIHHSDVFID